MPTPSQSRLLLLTGALAILPLGAASPDWTRPRIDAIFKLIGGVEHLNRRCLPLRLDGLDLLLDTGRELLDADFAPQERTRWTALLGRDQALRRRLRAALRAREGLAGPAQGSLTGLLSRRAGRFQLTRLIVADAQGSRRYRPAPAGFGLVLDPDYQHLPPLRVQGPHLLRADSGERVVLKGLSLFYRRDLRSSTSGWWPGSGPNWRPTRAWGWSPIWCGSPISPMNCRRRIWPHSRCWRGCSPSAESIW